MTDNRLHNSDALHALIAERLGADAAADARGAHGSDPSVLDDDRRQRG